MEIVDYGRSFLTFRLDFLKLPPQTVSHPPPYSLNSARIQIDCRCEIRDAQTGQSQEFVLGANCKTERVGVERDIWLSPNADFRPVYSRSQFLIIKTYDHIGREREVFLYPKERGHQPDRQTGNVAGTYESFQIHQVYSAAERLETPHAIVNATLANHPLVARTEYREGRYDVLLEYPVTTMNANERDWVYQTDTGPILVPDLSRPPEELIGGFQLAFSAFNSPDWIELIVRAPTPLPSGVSVYHYSQSLRKEGVRNTVFRLK